VLLCVVAVAGSMKTNTFYNGLIIIVIVSGAVTGATLLVSFIVFVCRI